MAKSLYRSRLSHHALPQNVLAIAPREGATGDSVAPAFFALTAADSAFLLRAATGTPVLCSGPGRIALAADLYYSGGTVIVDHGGGLFTIYAHLSKIEAKEGAKIAAGDRVGLSGATGRVTGPHLHWGARVGSEIFDPRALLDPRLFGSTP